MGLNAVLAGKECCHILTRQEGRFYKEYPYFQKIDLQDIISGSIQSHDWPIHGATEKLSKIDMYIDDTASIFLNRT